MKLLLLEEGHCFRDQALAFCGLRASAPREGMDGSTLSVYGRVLFGGQSRTDYAQSMGTGVGLRYKPLGQANLNLYAAQDSCGFVQGRSSVVPVSFDAWQQAGLDIDSSCSRLSELGVDLPIETGDPETWTDETLASLVPRPDSLGCVNGPRGAVDCQGIRDPLTAEDFEPLPANTWARPVWVRQRYPWW